MPNLTLADGLPVWEGAAVLHKFWRGQRLFVTYITPDGKVETDCEKGGMSPTLSTEYAGLDLDHQPTFLNLAYLTAEKWGMHVTVDPGAPLRFYRLDILTETEVTDADDLRSLWLNGPAPAPE